MTFGQKLQNLRKEKNWSQEELAGKITVSRQAVSKWELDEVTPDTENIIQLSEVFNVSTDFLLKDSYSSDKDIPAVKHTETRISNEINLKWMLRTGYALLLIGVCIIGTLRTLAAIIPYRNGFRGYISFLSFLDRYYLHWVLVLGCVFIVAAIVFFFRYRCMKKKKG